MTLMKESKRTVEVFPDYCSSGFWLVNIDDTDGSPHGYHVNISAEELEISAGLALAVKYWHSYWESFINYWIDGETGEIPESCEWYVDRWIVDGGWSEAS